MRLFWKPYFLFRSIPVMLNLLSIPNLLELGMLYELAA